MAQNDTTVVIFLMFAVFTLPILVDNVELNTTEVVTLVSLKISNNVSWNTYTPHDQDSTDICVLFHLLQCSKVASKDIAHMFYSRTRPILEYAAPVWHPGFTKGHTDVF